jgi:hypothetical protein
MPAGPDDTETLEPHSEDVDTAGVIADAMTDYLLAQGTKKAPATRAPAHMAAWLEARGYRIVRSPAPRSVGRATAPRSVDQGDPDEITRIVSSIDWHSTGVASENRGEIVRRLIDAVKAAAAASADRRRAWMGVRYPSRFRPTIVPIPTACGERTADGAGPTEASTSSSLDAELPCSSLCPCSIELSGSHHESAPLRSVRALRPVPDTRAAKTPRASVELPEPLRLAGYAESDQHRLTWTGGVHLVGSRTVVIPGRTLDHPEEARAHAAAVLAAAERMQP